MKQPIDQARCFLQLAERDVQAFIVLKGAKNVDLSTVCFHAQQAVEKFLKAVLIVNKIDPKRTYDLNELAYLLQNNNIQLPLTIENISKLNPYAVIFRYDDADIETLSRDEAAVIVNAIKQWAHSLVQ